MNTLIISGNIVRDPEEKVFGDKKLVRFSVAVRQEFKTEGEYLTDYFECVAWDKKGEFVKKYFGKGSKVSVQGSYNSKKGGPENKTVYWTLKVEKVEPQGPLVAREDADGATNTAKDPFEEKEEKDPFED